MIRVVPKPAVTKTQASQHLVDGDRRGDREVTPRPAAIPDGVLLDTLASSLLPAFRARTGIVCRLNVSAGWPRHLPDTASALLYRLVNAALADIESDPRQVHQIQVSLDTSGSNLIVSISDDGRYLARPARGRRGSSRLMMVRDLAFLLGGHLVIETRQGPGITIKVMVPMQKVRERQAAPLRAARVLVADDRSLLQTGVIKLLADDDRVEVVGQASDEEHLIELAESLRPDVVLLNLQGPSTRVANIVLQLKRSIPPVSVIVLNSADADICLEALAAGASGCIPEYPEPEVLISGIVSVLGGLCLFPRSIEPLALARAPRQHGTAQHLTQRELQVIRLAATGLSNKEIARHLGASYKTIRNQMSSIYTKLQIHDRSQAVLYAIRAGLV